MILTCLNIFILLNHTLISSGLRKMFSLLALRSSRIFLSFENRRLQVFMEAYLTLSFTLFASTKILDVPLLSNSKALKWILLAFLFYLVIILDVRESIDFFCSGIEELLDLELLLRLSKRFWLIIFFFVSLKFWALLKMFYLALNTVLFLTSKEMGLYLPLREIALVRAKEKPLLIDSLKSSWRANSLFSSWGSQIIIFSKSFTYLTLLWRAIWASYADSLWKLPVLYSSERANSFLPSSSKVTTKLLSNSSKNYSVLRWCSGSLCSAESRSIRLGKEISMGLPICFWLVQESWNRISSAKSFFCLNIDLR